jgi:GNAT superfamily N-acetyltransferase
MGTATVKIVGYDLRYAKAFAALNYEWIETFFRVEDEDRKALEDPEGYAINPGGEIFFLLENDVAVGTAAMVPYGSDKLYELAKMAVRPDKRGLGYGSRLMQRCVDFARDRNADEVMLVTNDILAPALATYEAAGFRPVENYTDSRYERGNLEMRLRL